VEVNAKDRKYYWLKLQKDFFDSGTIQIIETMPNGMMYSHFYIKALCKSIEWGGFLMLNQKFPHSVETLAAVMKMDVEIVRGAIETLMSFEMIKQNENGAYYLPELQTMLGNETYWAKRKREQRERVSDGPF